MGKLKISIVLMMVVCVLMMGLFGSPTVGEEDQQQEKSKQPIKATLTERLTSLLYVSSPSSSSSSSGSGSPSSLSNWDKLKTFLHQSHAYFFPPNLESGETDESVVSSTSSGGAGEKVKEAVTKSLEKSKESVEGSAKSAAKIAGETVHKTTEKLKKLKSEEL
ncbi:hypothetical protein TIFTF001_023585 [Ficus carica]|uniref:Transmembrane protein n=1 Tax=Ficus carica TaxID=3494 RepID=A0AA88AF09_FICCA|nr:hypothetical protein TIFTF001_023585 [Ficus carica]